MTTQIVTRRTQPLAEVGSSGLRRFGGQIDEEYDPTLKGRRGAQKYQEMRDGDPDIGAILTALEMVILSVDWMVESAGNTPADEEAAAFLESCLDDMTHSWKDFLSNVATMFPFGWAWFEMVYKLRDGPKPEDSDVASSKFDDGRIGWRKVALRMQASLDRWEFDDRGGIKGMWQRPVTGPAVFMPIQKCVLFRTRTEGGNPEGRSILRNAYRPYYIKTNVEEIEVMAAERDMTGVPVITLPLGATVDDKDAALEILEKLKWDDQAGLVLPTMGEGDHQRWRFELAASPGAQKIDTDKTIQRETVAIARSVLAQFLTLGAGRVGSYALSRDMRDLFHLTVKGHLDRMEETINRFMVERLFQLNQFPNLTAIPRIVHGRMGQREIGPFVQALMQLGTLGMPFRPDDWNFIRSEMEMPELPVDEGSPEEQSTPEPAAGDLPAEQAAAARERSRAYLFGERNQWQRLSSQQRRNGTPGSSRPSAPTTSTRPRKTY